MDKQENLKNKFDRLLVNLTNIPEKITGAVQNGMSEPSNLACVKDELLDFELIEDEIKQIHENLKAGGNRVLGSRLILDQEHDRMEITTYTKRGDKNFSVTVDAIVKEVTNIPRDVVDELQETGRVKIDYKD